MRHLPFTIPLALAAGCSNEEEPAQAPVSFPIGVTQTNPPANNPPTNNPPTTTTEGCSYPAGAVEPMAEGAVLSPYRWPVAIHRGTGASADLDLAAAPCATDPDIDWSPHDVLVFVSIPAW